MSEDIKLLVRIEATAKQFERRMDAIARKQGRIHDKLERRAAASDAKLSKFGSKFGESFINRAAKVIAAYEAVRRTLNFGISAADDRRLGIAKLTDATGSEARGKAAFQKSFNLAQQLRVPVSDITDQFVRLRAVANELDRTDDDVLRVIESFIKLGRLGGRATSELAAAAQQYSQALGKGKLDGEELNSILENALPVAKKIAEEFGVGVGALKDMGEAGELVSDRVFDALATKTDDLDKRFAQLPVTFSEGMQTVGTSVRAVIADMDEATGAVKLFTEGALGASSILERLRGNGQEGQDLVAAVRRLTELEAELAALKENPSRDPYGLRIRDLQRLIKLANEFIRREEDIVKGGASTAQTGGGAGDDRLGLGRAGRSATGRPPIGAALKLTELRAAATADAIDDVTASSVRLGRDGERAFIALADVAARFAGGLDDIGDAAKRAGLELLEMVLRGAIGGQGPFGGAFNSLFGVAAGGLAGLFGGGTYTGQNFSTAGFGNFGYAKGGAFAGGREIRFARGGVVARPTNFPMAGGDIGLMGEAGPEAILPLQRGPGGKLGVAAHGGGGTVINQSVNVIVEGNAGPDTPRQIAEAVARATPQIVARSVEAVGQQARRSGDYRRVLSGGR